MHQNFEEAAHLLRMMTGVGLMVIPTTDYRLLITKLAVHLQQLKTQRISHATAAAAALSDLELNGMVTSSDLRRDKVLAVAGTVMGNFETMAHRANR